MTLLTFSLLLLGFSFLGGALGALTGLGGGVVIIPVLVLIFHIPIHYAMGASLISVIATSNGAATSYLRKGYTNIRIGLLLEIAAVTGAILGAMLITHLSTTFLTTVFSITLFISAYLTMKHAALDNISMGSHPWAKYLNLEGTHLLDGKVQQYHVQNVPLALGIIGIAGILSGLLGIGSGALKVLAMDNSLKLPYKVATATSNFMIGITAVASIGIYLRQGYIYPALAGPVLIGAFAGSIYGMKLLTIMNTQSLRLIFSIAICAIGLQMLYETFMR